MPTDGDRELRLELRSDTPATLKLPVPAGTWRLRIEPPVEGVVIRALDTPIEPDTDRLRIPADTDLTLELHQTRVGDHPRRVTAVVLERVR